MLLTHTILLTLGTKHSIHMTPSLSPHCLLQVDAESAPTHNGGIVENGYHDNSPIVENGISEQEIFENGEEEEFAESKRRWSFPPVLDDFNLMESEADPTDLEAVFADDRYVLSLTHTSLYFQHFSLLHGKQILK